MEKEAVIQDNYRYFLLRLWDDSLPRCMFVMLNPSTADHEEDDPTIRRCIDFVTRWGFGGLYVGNVFAYKATEPKDLLKAHKNGIDCVGPLNYHYMSVMKEKSSLVIFAWGTHKLVTKEWVEAMRYFFPDAKCITISKHGKPVHPLFLRKTLTPIPFK